MRTRVLTALAAASVLLLAACGDDDDDAAGDTTIAVVAPPTEAAGPATSEAGAPGVATSEAGAPGVATSEAGAPGVATSEAGVAGVATSEAGAAGVATSEAGAPGVATSEAGAAGVATTDGAGVAATEVAGVEATEVGAETTAAAGVETTAAAGVETTAAGGVATSEPSTATSAPGETSVPGTGPATSEPGSSVPAGEPGAIVVGSADFNESQLLAQIYGQALEAAGFDVSYELAIGSREVYLGAIENGEIDLVPEYTNSLLSFITQPDVPETESVEDQIAALEEALPEGLEVLTPSTAEDKDVIVCTQEVVDELGLSNLSSLFENSAEITIGGPPELETRSPFGIAGFSELFGAEFEAFVPLGVVDVAAALEGGQIDCGNLFSTMSAMQTEGFIALEDDVNLVPHEAVLPLVRSDVVTPELTAALDEVNAALDTETLTELLAQVEVEQLGADVVAAEFLASLGGDGAPVTTGGDAAPATTAGDAAPETTGGDAAPATTGGDAAPATTGG